MRIGDEVPLPEPKTIKDASSDGEDSVQSVPAHGSEEAITESFPGDVSAQSPQLLDNLIPDRLEPHRPDNIFEDQVKIDVFSNPPGNLDLTQGLNPANLTEHDVDRHYLGLSGPDLPNFDPTGLLGGSKPSSGPTAPGGNSIVAG